MAEIKITGDWLSVIDVLHRSEFEFFETEEDARLYIASGQDQGVCYGVAIFHISTRTLTMIDPMDMCDKSKVQAGIDEFLTATETQRTQSDTNKESRNP